MALYVRELTEEERFTVERLCNAQTAPVRLVRRARIIRLSSEGKTVPTIAKEIAFAPSTIRDWIKRFNTNGIAGFDDMPRAGRSRLYDEDQRSWVIAKARSAPPKPEGADVPPTCHWTLDQLQEELNKDGLPIKRSQIRRVLKAEHIKWQKPRTWLESDDPQFAEKRGPSSSFIPSRLKAVRL